MIYNILTSFNQKYWNEVAKDNVVALDNNWVKDGNIFLYHELPNMPTDVLLSSRVHWIDLYKTCPEILEFGNTWKDNNKANGTKGFRTNAIKFVHKTFAIWHCQKQQSSGWLIWLDCDAFVHSPIDNIFLKEACNPSAMISYLGRPGKYSECGFLAFNLDHPKTREFLDEWETLYTSGEFINLSETHDSWTFDYIRKKWNSPDLFLNLNAAAITDKNPFSQSKIGPYVVHAKGDDKQKQINRFKSRNGK